MLSRCFLDFSVGVGAFVIGLSKISSIFTCNGVYTYIHYIEIIQNATPNGGDIYQLSQLCIDIDKK